MSASAADVLVESILDWGIGFLEKAQKGMTDWWELMRAQGTADDVPIKPQRVAWELSDLVADDAIISTDSGTITSWIARHFRMRGTQKFSCSGNLATMALNLHAVAINQFSSEVTLNRHHE